MTYAQRLRFGRGRLAELGELLDELGLGAVGVLSGPHHAALGAALLERLGPRGSFSFGEAVEHTPVEVTERAEAEAARRGAQALVAIGGGAAIGLGKALSLRLRLPLVAVPTTFSGSEMTTVVGERRDGVKTTRRDERALPRAVLYDADLAATMPPRLAATSGLNALAHAFGALLAPDASPFSDRDATEAIRLLSAFLPDVVEGAGGVEESLLGAALAGRCLAATTMGLHHRLCHLLGGSYGLPHSPTHAALLPYAVACEEGRGAARLAGAAAALGVPPGGVSEALFALQARLAAPRSLGELGLRAEDVAPCAASAAAAGGEAEAVAALLEQARVGR
ncbi:MAG TPA: iron-containing alcohol dehydrogenase [Acidimicrobiales bacterium]|nr:iron-containing alcohol dehydrogenase [Acidimicrobiales bacterium]